MARFFELVFALNVLAWAARKPAAFWFKSGAVVASLLIVGAMLQGHAAALFYPLFDLLGPLPPELLLLLPLTYLLLHILVFGLRKSPAG